jgi:hypothetical protein
MKSDSSGRTRTKHRSTQAQAAETNDKLKGLMQDEQVITK